MSLNFSAFALAIAATVFFLSPSARADACDDECDSDEPPCSVEERCPESGVSCFEEDDDYDDCIAKAKSDGLELRCVDNDDVYCAADEEIYVEDEGCALRSPKRPSRGLPVALATFGLATLAALSRLRRRAKR